MINKIYNIKTNNAKTDIEIAEEKEQISLAWLGAVATSRGGEVTAEGLNTEFTTNMTGGSITSIYIYISMALRLENKVAYWNAFSEVEENLVDFKSSVEENGGFYIGRYEASYLDGKLATVESSDITHEDEGN